MDIDTKAVDSVEEGELSEPYHSKGKNRYFNFLTRVDWNEFSHLIIVWLLGAFVIFTVLVLLTMVESSTNIVSADEKASLIKRVILRLDTLSLMFSLILSAGLEQVWNNKEQLKYKISMCMQLALSIMGLLLYLTYSIMSIVTPDNPYLNSRFGVHLGYIVVSTVAVIIGFIIRSYKE